MHCGAEVTESSTNKQHHLLAQDRILCIEQLMHESLPDTISFGLDNPKFLEIVVECLRMHRSTCTSHKDYQIYCPSLV